MSATSATFKTVLCSALLASLASCSSGGGGGAKGAAPNVKPNEAVKPGPKGAFEATREATLGDSGIPPKEFDLSERAECVGMSDQEKMKFRFDAQMKAGQKFRESFIQSTVDSTFGMDRVTTVSEASPNAAKFAHTLSNLTVVPHPGISIPATLNMIETCTAGAESSSCTSEYVDFKPPEENGSNTYCSIRNSEVTGTTGTVALGEFTMNSGAKVKARKIERVNKVNIVCRKGNEPEQDLGEGTELVTEIETTETVEIRPQSCYSRGSYVYSYRTLITKDGKTVQSVKSEVLEAPARQ